MVKHIKRLATIVTTCLILVLLVRYCGSVKSPNDVAPDLQHIKLGKSPHIAIKRQSIIEPTQWDHVISVHGFADNRYVAKNLVNYLNGTGPKVYIAVKLRHINTEKSSYVSIQRQIIREPTQWAHVISVHGFIDNPYVAKKLVNYLNSARPKVYRAVQIKKSLKPSENETIL